MVGGALLHSWPIVLQPFCDGSAQTCTELIRHVEEYLTALQSPGESETFTTIFMVAAQSPRRLDVYIAVLILTAFYGNGARSAARKSR